MHDRGKYYEEKCTESDWNGTILEGWSYSPLWINNSESDRGNSAVGRGNC